ncbi:peptidoglycan bridge formation glycyltransferase FemA/FemB family protein [Methanocella conradii]|uniref:peptidoglycan bridge formation glycyltransferase FemA/FemB family protein n=1 Tax=Methanocella conradii TaxID=1175444 RepID=UPI00157D9466|nr:peptidoglycan bridge formation glycyltransferase FemA/FemB family protein [Methanocella conradii]
MLEIERNFFNFRRKDIWFSDSPFDVEGCQGVAFYACKNKVDMPGFIRKDFVTPVIDLTMDEERIWKNIDRMSCRKKINKAYNNGIKLKVNQCYEEFLEVDSEFRKSKGLPGSHIDVDYMKKYGTLFVAMLDGKVICGEVFLEDKDHIRRLITASRRFTGDQHWNNIVGYGNRMIIWESIRYARAKGIKEYDMGGYYAGADKARELEGVNKFKMSFGPKLVTKYNYEKDYSRLFGVARRIYGFSAARIYRRSCWP